MPTSAEKGKNAPSIGLITLRGAGSSTKNDCKLPFLNSTTLSKEGLKKTKACLESVHAKQTGRTKLFVASNWETSDRDTHCIDTQKAFCDTSAFQQTRSRRSSCFSSSSSWHGNSPNKAARRIVGRRMRRSTVFKCRTPCAQTLFIRQNAVLVASHFTVKNTTSREVTTGS